LDVEVLVKDQQAYVMIKKDKHGQEITIFGAFCEQQEPQLQGKMNVSTT
jgi:hypothetical protein